MWLIMVAESKLHFSADLKLTFFVYVCVFFLLEKQLAVSGYIRHCILSFFFFFFGLYSEFLIRPVSCHAWLL